MSGIKIEAPIKIDLKVIVVNDEGGSGEVTIELPSMRFPSKQEIIDAINEASESEVVVNNGLRLADQKETFDYVCRERAGASFAMPRDRGEWYLKEDE